MAYFQNKKDRELVYSELAKGNENAKNILMKLSSMSQDELGLALSNFTPTPIEIKEVVLDLITAEFASIDNCNKIIAVLKETNTPENEFKIEQFKNLISQKLTEIVILKEIGKEE